MTYVEKTLIPGEIVQLTTRISLRQYWARFLLAAMLIACAIIFMPGSGLPAPGLMALVLILAALYGIASALISYRFTELAITNLRVVAKMGMIARRTIEIELQKIEAVRVEQGIFGRILNYGSLLISGTGGSREVLPAVQHPLEVRKALAVVMSLRAGGRSPSGGV